MHERRSGPRAPRTIIGRAAGFAALAALAGAVLAGCGSSGGGASGTEAPEAAAGAATDGTGPGGGEAEPSSGDDGASGGWRENPLYDTDAARLIAKGMDGDAVVKCTANTPDGATTAYVHGTHLRLDVGDGEDAQHFLTDGENTDFWQDDRPGGNVFVGEKAYNAVHSMVRNLGVDLDALRAQGGEQAAMLGPDTEIECGEYAGDADGGDDGDSVFAPPPGREFTTSQQIRGMVGGGD